MNMFVELLEKHQGQFLVFTGKFCGFCTAAKRFLDGKKLSYIEVSFDSEPSQLREEVVEATHHRTVPVIFDLRTEERIFIGGFDELTKYPM
jgi:glutaredoxin 3